MSRPWSSSYRTEIAEPHSSSDYRWTSSLDTPIAPVDQATRDFVAPLVEHAALTLALNEARLCSEASSFYR